MLSVIPPLSIYPPSVSVLRLLIFFCSTAPSQPSFHFSLHTNDRAPRLSANSFIPRSTPQLGAANNSIVQIQLHSCRTHHRSGVWKFCLATLFSLSPPCLVFFATCFSSIFCYVRQTEVEQASKWMAKPPFPLLALPFMHVILVPTPSPLSLYLCISLSFP